MVCWRKTEGVFQVTDHAIMEVKEMDDMHRAYQRGLLRHLEKMRAALERSDHEEAARLLAELIEDTQADIDE